MLQIFKIISLLFLEAMRRELIAREALCRRKPLLLTMSEATTLLNVSDHYLGTLLDSGVIPSEQTGAARYVPFPAAVAFKESMEAKRLAVLDELTREAQALRLGY